MTRVWPVFLVLDFQLFRVWFLVYCLSGLSFIFFPSVSALIISFSMMVFVVPSVCLSPCVGPERNCLQTGVCARRSQSTFTIHLGVLGLSSILRTSTWSISPSGGDYLTWKRRKTTLLLTNKNSNVQVINWGDTRIPTFPRLHHHQHSMSQLPSVIVVRASALHRCSRHTAPPLYSTGRAYSSAGPCLLFGLSPLPVPGSRVGSSSPITHRVNCSLDVPLLRVIWIAHQDPFALGDPTWCLWVFSTGLFKSIFSILWHFRLQWLCVTCSWKSSELISHRGHLPFKPTSFLTQSKLRELEMTILTCHQLQGHQWRSTLRIRFTCNTLFKISETCCLIRVMLKY